MTDFAEQKFPTLNLANGEIQVSIYLPDAETGFYRGTRFDWSGIIGRVNYRQHTFYAPLHATHDPTCHDAVCGPAEEFAMHHPMGFAEARPGESFVKIGVGLLQKGDDSQYRFEHDYRLIRAVDWEIERGADWVSFAQHLSAERGWGYHYQKTIRLIPDQAEILIEHQLRNSGEKIIDIDHYSHNFTLIDDLPYGPDYSVEFPFSSEQPIALGKLACFLDNRVVVDHALQQTALWSPLFEGVDPGGYNAALVRNNVTGGWVEFSGDAPITRMVFWAVERAACPEPFIHIRLRPGEEKNWSSRYRYGSDGGR